MEPTLTEQLAALARAATRPVVLADRPDGTVVRVGEAVAKAHAPGTAPDALRLRLAVAASPLLAGTLLPPLTPDDGPVPLADGRPASVWPLGSAVDPDNPDSAPWEAAGELLGELHSVPLTALARQLGAPVPPMRGPVKAATAVARMRAALRHGRPSPAHLAAAEAAERAWSGLPPRCRDEHPDAPGGAEHGPHGYPYTERPVPAALCHGDFHLGQLVRWPAPDGPWRLIDIDDLGTGDPAWDLARPAAWFAAGLLAPEAWSRFLGAYQRTRGTEGEDPWPGLDAPARALTVQTVALAVTKAHTAGRPFDEAEEACADSCARIAALTPEPARELARSLESCEAAGGDPAPRRVTRPANRPVGRGN
ncbi:phosphotransferase [Streptomyces sp. HNM0574]|uniref:phosphotransferase n=1 Tax=Streptomyces sp. HNM0574 TaxID=2714954 RepID=UPI0032164731